MILVNGRVCDGVAATDRGLCYGDGVFRTLAVQAGKPRHWLRHFARLGRDCAALRIPCPDEAVLSEELTRVAQSQPDGAVKVIVTRGPGERGYALPETPEPTRILMAAPRTQYPAEFAELGVRVHRCATRLGFQPGLAGVKHLNRLENVLARAEWSDVSIAEGLLLDAEGNAIEGTMSNLFLVERGTLITPDLGRCGVAGVTRDRVLEAAGRNGISCRIENIRYDRVLRAEEVWLVNSLIGVWQIRELDGRMWKPGVGMRQMRKWLDETSD